MTPRNVTVAAVLLLVALAPAAPPQQPPQEPDLGKQVQALAQRVEMLEKRLPVGGPAPSSTALTAVDTRLFRLETRLDRLEERGARPTGGALSSGDILRLESRLSSLESQVARLANR